MCRIIIGWAGIVGLAIVALANISVGQERRDVTFTTPFSPGKRPTTADFYYNDRAIGTGREAFAEILKQISVLPAGTSVVWGPNYDRCGSCSGSEPGCLPKHLHPDLWKQLEVIVRKRNLTLSSGYPTPWSQPTLRTPRHEFPKQLFADHAPDDKPFDAVLDWEVGEEADWEIERNRLKDIEHAAGRNHRFSSNKNGLVGYGLHLFFGRLPENSRVLVRLTLRDNAVRNDEAATTTALATAITQAWDELLARPMRLGKLQSAIVVPAALFKAFAERQPADNLDIQWRNYHGPNTPHDEVLYLANNEYLGRGDEGLDQILDRLNRLSVGARVTLPHYELSGRWVWDTLSRDEIEARNLKLKDLVPFHTRKPEFDAKLAARKAKLDTEGIQPGTKDGTVMDWHSGDRYAETIAGFGHIVHHTERPRLPAARLSWVRYDAHDRFQRKLETTAGYTIDAVEMGEGVAGFAKAMQKLAALPEGAVVHVQVSLRTKGSFVCPLIYEGQRHFERTGYEPYCGMLHWLVNVAEKRKLQIEWLPDEAKTCADCELNK